LRSPRHDRSFAPELPNGCRARCCSAGPVTDDATAVANAAANGQHAYAATAARGSVPHAANGHAKSTRSIYITNCDICNANSAWTVNAWTDAPNAVPSRAIHATATHATATHARIPNVATGCVSAMDAAISTTPTRRVHTASSHAATNGLWIQWPSAAARTDRRHATAVHTADGLWLQWNAAWNFPTTNATTNATNAV